MQAQEGPSYIYCPKCRGGNWPNALHCQWCGISLAAASGVAPPQAVTKGWRSWSRGKQFAIVFMVLWVAGAAIAAIYGGVTGKGLVGSGSRSSSNAVSKSGVTSTDLKVTNWTRTKTKSYEVSLKVDLTYQAAVPLRAASGTLYIYDGTFDRVLFERRLDFDRSFSLHTSVTWRGTTYINDYIEDDVRLRDASGLKAVFILEQAVLSTGERVTFP